MTKRLILLAVVFLLTPLAAFAQFGKNNVQYTQLNQFYQSYRFDVWHDLDPNDPAQMEYLRQVVENLENARDWMSGPKVFNHSIDRRIPVLFFKTHFEMESSNLVGGFLPEGVGAFVESERIRMVLKGDFSRPLGRAIGVHELAHEFQMDVYSSNVIQKAVGAERLPNGYFEGCAEYLAGIYDPHTRDDIRRREQRNYASNPKSLPTWDMLNSDEVNPYTMWSMIPEFIEAKYSSGIAFCTQPFKTKVRLGEFIYDMAKGELGNPDDNSEKFDQHHRSYWGTELGFEVERIKRMKPYEENDNFKGRTVTPYGHPYPMRSPALSLNGDELVAFTIQKNGVALVRFTIPPNSAYVSREDREKIKNDVTIKKFSGMNPIKNLTPQLPPVPWEYILVQGFETWPFNGSDVSWSNDGKQIAFFARINRDHALVIIDAETGKILKKVEVPFDQAFSPSFGADGYWVYFSGVKNITRDIYAIDLNDSKFGHVIKVTNGDRFYTAPAVSRDGSKVAYVGSDGDFQHLFLYDVKEGTQEQLTFGRFNDSAPSWSYDGSTLVYISDEADQIWNLYTLNIATKTVSQWTEFMGGVETPIFAKNSLDLVYYVVFRDDDQFKNFIYPNYEVFEAKLKKPIRQYVSEDKRVLLNFTFNPNRDLFRLELDPNQLINPQKPPEKWGCRSGDLNFGASTWGMVGSGYMGCSNMLETKEHVGLFVSYYGFKLYDYSYTNREKRATWRWGGHRYQMPLSYMFYDVVNRYPKQFIIQNAWLRESSFDLSVQYPRDKFNRWEFFSKLSNKSYNLFGYKPKDIGVIFELYPEEFSVQDVQTYRFLRDSNGSNLSFGTAYVRDTVLYSNETWGPWHGNAFRVQLEAAPPMGNEFRGYTSFNLDARTYRQLGSGSLFAGQAKLMASTEANGDFILLCGPERLRGCEYGSIIGNQIGYGSAELRFPVPGTYLLGVPVRGFLFVDVAYARFSNEEMGEQKLRTFGIGTQYFIPFLGLPAQSIWTRDNGKWKPTFYVTLHW